MANKGESWNESETYSDPVTLRRVRRLTRNGLYNQTPNYHTATGWTADGQHLLFASARDGGSAMMKAHVPSGRITQLTESFAGVGCLDELHKGNGLCVGNGLGVTMLSCVGPKKHWCVYVQGRSLRAVHLETLEDRVLIADYGQEWIAGIPSIDPGETHVILPVMSAHPELMSGLRPTKSNYVEYFSKRGPTVRFLQVSLDGGPVEEVYREDGIGCAHCPHNPIDPDLMLIDRDFPPGLWFGGDGKTNRIWTLNIRTRQLTELPARDDARFQSHSAWTWDGEAVVYHGGSSLGGHYIGVVSKTGRTLREYQFTDARHYGHVSAMANRPAIILDGNLTSDMLLFLYYDQETPRIEMIARHNTNWGSLPWQYPHPHPQSDPTGRYISFSSANKGRSDVFVVEV